MTCPLSLHALRNTIRLKLRGQAALQPLDEAAQAELAALLVVHEGVRGERLLEPGRGELRQFFVIEGLLKRVVTGPDGREMTLHFAGEGDLETCWDAWQQRAPARYAVVCAARSLVVSLPMAEWCAFLERHPAAERAFHTQLVAVASAIAEHAVTLLMLDAATRVLQFSDRHPELVERLPQKDVASHLNLSAETLCRLTRRQRAAGLAA
ncbi:Crp/Fnr family transcriptional regulator [Caenimonas sedimenti]|uniref:Crp/Fnr family transcriptional regulator n=1 Tax=Caenimonas sedimenti TaxID=2596921 RepID=A0A562ZKW8_9BURK|nr:Crp/Fnr family transcriptional regulator [Caenimonas sedimenti]TWO68986.1 Crp/Fnr family transcriptional regulator [Caenimonas sedimenti]